MLVVCPNLILKIQQTLSIFLDVETVFCFNIVILISPLPPWINGVGVCCAATAAEHALRRWTWCMRGMHGAYGAEVHA